MTITTVDKSGRICIGKQYAGRNIVVREVSATEIHLETVRVIPEREAWLYENPEALAMVRRGLQEARDAKSATNPPDIDADAS